MRARHQCDMATCSTGSVEKSRHLLRQLSHQSSSESSVSEELDLLSNVYFDDLHVSQTDKGHCLSLHITPSTADDKDRQFVYLDINLLLPSKYPHVVPDVSLGQSRGLSDAHLRGISEGLALKSEELVGSPMVYELVEYARDCLTDNNLPCGQCAVCQIHFQDGDDFTKTDCYHYLHVVCMARYIEFFEREKKEREREEAMVDTMLRRKPKQLDCPVCREPIPSGSACLDAACRVLPVALLREDDIQFTPSTELKEWQTRMASLLWQQTQKGGVIDPNREDVIDETWVSSVSRTGDSEPVDNRGNTLSDNHKEWSEVTAKGSDNEHDTSGNTTEVQRSGDGNAVCRRTYDKPRYGQDRKREMDRHVNVSGKSAEAPRTGERNATSKKPMQGGDQGRRKEHRDNGRYHHRGGRELRDNGQRRYREQGRDQGMDSNYSGRSRAHPQRRDQRSRSDGQPRWRGGRGSRSADSDSTNNQSTHRQTQHKVAMPTAGTKDAIPTASVEVTVPAAAAGIVNTVPATSVKSGANQSRTGSQDTINQRQRTKN